MVPPESFLGLVPNWIALYLVTLVAFGLGAFALYWRVFRFVLVGRPAAFRVDRFPQRLLQMLVVVVAQTRVLQSFSRRDWAGLGHALIFWGFLSTTTSYLLFIFIDSLPFFAHFSETLLRPLGLRIFVQYMDVVQVTILVALAWGFYRRWISKPRRLLFDLTRKADALYIVLLIGLLMTFALLTEAFFVAKGGVGIHGEGFVGRALGEGFRSLGVSETAATVAHGLFWWAHLSIILGFAIYIPLSKHLHVVAAPVNAFFRKLEPQGTLFPILDIENATSFGADRLQDFTWKELLDGFACAVCGRCSSVCPANLTGKVLSPMHIVENIKDHLQEHGSAIAKGEEVPGVIGHAVEEQAVWDCVMCGACVAECPVTVEHIDSILEMRRSLVLEKGRLPKAAEAALRSIETRGNPGFGTTHGRLDWTEGLDVPLVSEVGGENIEVLFWVGCAGSLEDRSMRVARSIATILKKAGVKFAILGTEESCTGDPARRLGNEYLFQLQAQQNIQTLANHNIKKILTMCPHCFNSIRNEYSYLGGKYEVVHHTQFLQELIAQRRLLLNENRDGLQWTVTYHDPCYLGRHNGIYDEPREVVTRLVGEERLVEMEQHKQRAFCCGAGGGHYWYEEAEGTERMPTRRTTQAIESGANTIGTACPYCTQMFDLGLRVHGKEEEIQVLDIAEMVSQRLAEIPAQASPGSPG